MAELSTIWASDFPLGQAPRRLPLRLTDGYETAVYLHTPPPSAPPNLPILQMHGIQSHPGWFGASAGAMAEAGHAVYQVTRRGSGENGRARGHTASAAQLLDDVRTACEFVLRRESAGRLHMVGISWGGKLAACYCCDSGRAAGVASLTLVAPGIAPQVDIQAAKKLAVAWSLLTNPARPFDIPLNEVELFTDNPAMWEYLRRDPLRLRQATARFLYVSRMLDRQLRRAPAGAIQLPVTLMLAGRDRIIDNARAKQFIDRLTVGNAKVVELPAAHSLEFEESPDEFFRLLISATGDKS